MKRYSGLRASRPWLLLVGVVILIAGHGAILYYFSSHLALSAAVLSGVVVLVVIKHLGLFGPVCALLRRARRTGPPDGK